MNKRLRSRVLAVGVFSTSLFAAGMMLYGTQPARAQEKPTPTEILQRGNKLYKEQQYQEAKKILLEIDPAQLPEAQRSQRDELIKQADLALAKSAPSTETFDNAKAALDAGQLAQAAKLYDAVITSPNANPELKQDARIQLALVQQKQKDKAPAMKALLKDAIAAYEAGRLDEAQNALNTIQSTGSELGWADEDKPAKYTKLIAAKKAELAKASVPVVTTVSADSISLKTQPATSPTEAVAGSTPVAVTASATTVPAGAGTELLDQHLTTRSIEQQQALTRYNHLKEVSTQALAAGNYQSAVDNAKDAKVVAETSSDLFSANESAELLKDADNLLKTATAKATEAKAAADARAVKDAAENDKKVAAQRMVDRQAKIKAMMDQAAAAAERQQYDQAIGTLDQIIAIEPTNTVAKYFRRNMEDMKNYRVWQRTQDTKVLENVRQTNESEKLLIPYADLMTYPENWPELTRRRQADQQSSDVDVNKNVRELLDSDLDVLHAEGKPFKDVVEYLQTKMREKLPSANVVVNWSALETASVNKDKEVSVNLQNVSFRKALNTVLMAASDGSGNLGFTLDSGVVTISSKEDLNSAKYQVVRVYDIREMLVQSNSTASMPTLQMGISTTSLQSGSNSSGSNSDNSLLGNNTNTTNNNGTNGTTKGRSDVVTEITDTIKATVAPSTWTDNGGSIGSIKELNGQLIVNQTVENQAQVYSLLQKLGEQHSLQISIETRLLLVSNNFLDDFGLGWGMTIPAGGLGANISSATISNNTSSMATSPITGVPGSLGGRALNNDSLNLSATGQILDNWQLNMLIRATQADKRTSTVTAPRVTIRDGESGWITVSGQQNYVSNFSQTTSSGGVNGNGTVGTSLTVSTLTTGVQLNVTANVSADRRYVTMTLDPTLTNLEGIDTYVVRNAGSTTTSTTTSTSGSSSSSSSSSSGTSGSLTDLDGAFVQLPRISTTNVHTTVSVPDGGTLLIGGQKIVGEAEIEVGVPVLSKIPGLNRLFTNRSYTKDERTLLILVRPKIIIQREEEYRNFGMNFDVLPSGTASQTNAAEGTVK